MKITISREYPKPISNLTIFKAEIIDNILLSFYNSMYVGHTFDYMLPTAKSFDDILTFLKTNLCNNPHNKLIKIESKYTNITISTGLTSFYFEKDGTSKIYSIENLPTVIIEVFDSLKYEKLFENPIGKVLLTLQKADNIVQLDIREHYVNVRYVSSFEVYSFRWEEIGNEIQKLIYAGYKFKSKEVEVVRPSGVDFWLDVFEAVTR